MTETTHIVIAGGGRVGHRVAQRFRDRGSTATVIDPDPDSAGRVESDEIEYLRGDATRPSVLREAITDQTTVVGALTDRTDTNLVVCLAAKRLSSDLRTVARIDDRTGDEYREYVDEVYFPERASVRAAVNALTGSDIRTLEEVTGDLEVLDIRIDYEAPAAGEVVADTLPEGSVVIAETDGNVAVQHSTTLVAGRRYLIAADQDVVNEVIQQCRGESAT
ncbi:MAG: NAD-binding protein [Halobacteriales archaeon]|nr:NAD-binding protein [Halobacteriales archaeon]